jgi:hypothetical protein
MAEDPNAFKVYALGSQLVAPCVGPNDEKEFGLTKRELFAAMAMQALCTPISGDEDPQLWSYDQLADSAVKAADALLQRLAR